MKGKFFMKRLMISRLGSLVLFSLVAVLSAQAQKGQWSDLNRLKPGQGIEVIESNMKHHSGDFLNVSEEALTLQENGSNVSIKRDQVARVSTSSASKRVEIRANDGQVLGTNGAVVGTFTVGTSPGFLAFDGANIWVAGRTGLHWAAPGK